MSKKLIICLILGIILLSLVLFLRFSSVATNVLWVLSKEGKLLLPLLGASAVLDSINPCAFSVLIVTIAFLFGIGKFRSRILQIGGVYIFGIFLVYTLIGLGILQALHFFNTPHFMAKVGAVLLILFGATNLINEFFPAFPIKLRIPQSAHHKIAEYIEKGSVPAAFFLGGLVGFCEFPCTGGPYLMVLGLLHDQATYFKGLLYLLLYNAIFVFPLILLLLIASEKTLLEKVKIWQQKKRKLLRLGVGLGMIGLGIIVFSL